MISQEEQNRIVDNAWTKLHQRLDADRLLVKHTKPENVLKRYPIARWAAAIIVLFASLATVYISTRPTNSTLLTLHNGEGNPALATTLQDGSVVLLGEETSLHYPNRFAKDKREVALQGKALFDISADAKKPFIIDTELVRVEVIGTKFNVECSNKDSFFLSVKSGKVKTTLKGKSQTVYVKAGESVCLDYGSLQKTMTENTSLFSSLAGNIQFKDEQLVNVAKVINGLSDSIQLNISPDVANRLITITVTDSSPYTFAKVICAALDLKLSQENNTLTISSKN